MDEVQFYQTPDLELLPTLEKIYLENFPGADAKPFDKIESDLKSGKYLLTLLKSNNLTIGFCFLLKLEKSRAMLLEYFAIDQNFQNQGKGWILLSKTLEEIEKDNNLILLEIHPDKSSKSLKSFYQKFGFEILLDEKVYRMPDFKDGTEIPLQLMVKNRKQFIFHDNEIINLITGIYEVAYPDFPNLKDRIIEIYKTGNKPL